jgi:hypothetical protein
MSTQCKPYIDKHRSINSWLVNLLRNSVTTESYADPTIKAPLMELNMQGRSTTSYIVLTAYNRGWRLHVLHEVIGHDLMHVYSNEKWLLQDCLCNRQNPRPQKPTEKASNRQEGLFRPQQSQKIQHILKWNKKFQR